MGGNFDLFWFIVGLVLGYLGIPMIVGFIGRGKSA